MMTPIHILLLAALVRKMRGLLAKRRLVVERAMMRRRMIAEAAAAAVDALENDRFLLDLPGASDRPGIGG